MTALDDQTRAVLAAWRVPGSHPDHHRGMQRQLRRDWPVLAQALDAMADAAVTAPPASAVRDVVSIPVSEVRAGDVLVRDPVLVSAVEPYGEQGGMVMRGADARGARVSYVTTAESQVAAVRPGAGAR